MNSQNRQETPNNHRVRFFPPCGRFQRKCALLSLVLWLVFEHGLTFVGIGKTEEYPVSAGLWFWLFDFWSLFWDFEFLAWFTSVNIASGFSLDHIDLSLLQTQPIEAANGFAAFSMFYNFNHSRIILSNLSLLSLIPNRNQHLTFYNDVLDPDRRLFIPDN